MTTPSPDPRIILDGIDIDGLAITPPLKNHIIRWMAGRGIADPFRYLAAILEKPEGDPGGIRQFIAARGRELHNPVAPPRPPRPEWCRECDEETRQTGLPDHPARCIRCHEYSLRPPAEAPVTLGNPARSPVVLARTPANPDAADQARRGAAMARDGLAAKRRAAAAVDPGDTTMAAP
jgi:hypothetical protein